MKQMWTERIRIIALLAVAIISQAVGNVLLSQGMKLIAGESQLTGNNWVSIFLQAVQSPSILFGVGFYVIFFVLFSPALCSWSCISSGFLLSCLGPTSVLCFPQPRWSMSLAPLPPSSSCRKRSPCIAGRGRCSSVWAWDWCRSRKSRAHKAEGNGETLEGVKQDIAPGRRIPAAKIQFLPEDRIWIAERIQEVLATGQ